MNYRLRKHPLLTISAVKEVASIEKQLKKNPGRGYPIRGWCSKPDDDLLSHGETPHYHRRRAVSLLSSAWDQVVPTRYDRQANRLDEPFALQQNDPNEANSMCRLHLGSNE